MVVKMHKDSLQIDTEWCEAGVCITDTSINQKDRILI